MNEYNYEADGMNSCKIKKLTVKDSQSESESPRLILGVTWKHMTFYLFQIQIAGKCNGMLLLLL